MRGSWQAPLPRRAGVPSLAGLASREPPYPLKRVPSPRERGDLLEAHTEADFPRGASREISLRIGLELSPPLAGEMSPKVTEGALPGPSRNIALGALRAWVDIIAGGIAHTGGKPCMNR